MPREVAYGEGVSLPIRLGGLGSVVSSPSGVWGEAPADFDLGAFCYYNLASDGNDINKFPIFNQPAYSAIYCSPMFSTFANEAMSAESF